MDSLVRGVLCCVARDFDLVMDALAGGVFIRGQRDI